MQQPLLLWACSALLELQIFLLIYRLLAKSLVLFLLEKQAWSSNLKELKHQAIKDREMSHKTASWHALHVIRWHQLKDDDAGMHC